MACRCRTEDGDADSYIGVTETSRILKIHPHTVRRLIREGRLPALRAGAQLRIRRSDISALAV